MVKILQVLAQARNGSGKSKQARSSKNKTPGLLTERVIPVPANLITTSTGMAPTANRRRRRRAGKRAAFTGPAQAWLKTLADPFEYAGVRTGFGCMIPTGLQALYQRGSFAANADGSFTCGCHAAASAGNFFWTSNAGAAATPVYTGLTAIGMTALTGSYSVGRVVSFGLRVRVLQAMTAAPGVMAGFANPILDNQNLFNFTTTPTATLTVPNAHLAYGNETVQVLWRPRGAEDFVFSPLNNATGPCFGSGQLIVSGTGYPAGATVFFETVLHVECVPSTQAGSADISDTADGWMQTAFTTLSDAYNFMTSLPPEVTSTVQTMFGLNAAAARGVRGTGRSTNTGLTIQEAKEF